jgi:hypothetical protein
VLHTQGLPRLRTLQSYRPTATPKYARYVQFLLPPQTRFILASGGSNPVNCQYCGKGFWLASKVIDDPDFCNPAHRWKFRKRLETGMTMIRRSSERDAIRSAGFQAGTRDPQVLEPACHATAGALFARLHVMSLAWMPLSLTADTPHFEPDIEVADGSADHHQQPHAGQEKRVSELVAGLRADIERRRREKGTLRLCRGPVLIDNRTLASASA